MKEANVEFFKKAERAIQSAKRELKAGDTEASASRAYYAMFYVVEALLFEEGLVFKKHSAVHAAFGKHFAKTGKLDPKYHDWILEAFENRITSDYEIGSTISTEEVSIVIQQAHEFLDVARQYLSDK